MKTIAIAAALASVTLLAGCGSDDQEPAADPTTKASDSPSATTDPYAELAKACNTWVNGADDAFDKKAHEANGALVDVILSSTQDPEVQDAFEPFAAVIANAEATIGTPDYIDASGAFDNALVTLDGRCETAGVDGVVAGN